MINNSIKDKRILQVLDTLQVGGGERIAINCINLLNRNGIRSDMVKIFDEGEQEGEIDSPAVIYHLKSRGRKDLKAMKQFAEIARSYDIIHVHMRGAFKYTMLTRFLFGFDTPILFHDHYGDIGIDKSVPPFYKWMLSRKYVYYAGVANTLKDWAIEQVGMSISKAFVLENTILVAEGLPDSEPPAGDKAIKFLQVSNVRRSKHLEFGISFIAALRARGYDVLLTQVGQPVDKSYFDEIVSLKKDLGMENFVTSVTNCSNVQAIMHQFHFGLHTAVSESGPLSVIEFMAQKLPFLASDTGEVIQTIKPALPECIVSDFEMNKWIAAFQTLLQMNRAAIQLRIKNEFERSFSEKSYLEKYVGIFETMLNG